MSLFNAINRLQLSLFEAFSGPATSFCRLETSDDSVTLAADDSSLVSALKIEGALERMTPAAYDRVAALMTEKTGAILEKPGHSLKLVFQYDPQKGREQLAGCFKPARSAARASGLDLGGLLTGWEKTLGRKTGGEDLWLVIWTKPSLLAAAQRKKAVSSHLKSLGPELGWPGQKENFGLPELREAHRGSVLALSEALKGAGLLNRLIPARELVRDIRAALFPALTPPDWSPVLAGDLTPFILPDLYERPEKILCYPKLAGQIFPRRADIIRRDFVLLGDRLHAPFFLAVPPREPKPFNELFRSLARRRHPWRLAVDISPGDLSQWSLQGVLARVLSFTSVHNRRISLALDYLRSLRDRGAVLVALSFSLDTWVEITDFPGLGQAETALRRQLAELERLFSGWGQSTVQEVTGDPLLGVAATLPAVMPNSPAPRALAPLEQTWGFLPLRPASAWRSGPLVFMSSDGKALPFWPNSSQQAAWIDLGVAPMGSGKSVLLNAFNLAFCLQPGLKSLPMLSVIDVGPSSMGLITLLKSALPGSLKHLVAGYRLRPTPEYSINPFDTPLGLRAPLPAQLSFLINLLCLLATPLGGTAPPDGTAGIVRVAIEAAYREAESPGRLFESAAVPALYGRITGAGFPAEPGSTWWEAVDFLFNQGQIHLAALAQRQAGPTLADIISQIRRHPGLRATYAFKVSGTGENILDYVWRALTESLGEYRLLAGPTRFSPGEARIISLDLDEVAPRGGGAAGDKRAAVMYMLARHTAASKFFLMPADVPLMPEAYRAYHHRNIKDLRRTPKRLCYDEIHRLTGLKAASRQLTGDLTTSARESRKWNLSIGLYSQAPEDFPPIFQELATSVFILGAGTEKGLETLARTFGLNETVALGLSRMAPPGPDGSNLAALFKTASGRTQDLLTLTLSPELRWAFSTTAEDAAVRDELYRQFGVDSTLCYLAGRWPGGLKPVLEERADRDDSYGQGDLLNELLKEAAEALRKPAAGLSGSPGPSPEDSFPGRINSAGPSSGGSHADRNCSPGSGLKSPLKPRIPPAGLQGSGFSGSRPGRPLTGKPFSPRRAPGFTGGSRNPASDISADSSSAVSSANSSANAPASSSAVSTDRLSGISAAGSSDRRPGQTPGRSCSRRK
jgi:intracellular multiplication protein IcmB